MNNPCTHDIESIWIPHQFHHGNIQSVMIDWIHKHHRPRGQAARTLVTHTVDIIPHVCSVAISLYNGTHREKWSLAPHSLNQLQCQALHNQLYCFGWKEYRGYNTPHVTGGCSGHTLVQSVNTFSVTMGF
jgi:hypothetical protein